MNFIKKLFQKGKKAIATGAMAVGAMAVGLLSGGSKVSAAPAAPNTGNTDVDAILTELGSVFEISKSGFVYLATAAVILTIILIAFFWLRSKTKQAVHGA